MAVEAEGSDAEAALDALCAYLDTAEAGTRRPRRCGRAGLGAPSRRRRPDCRPARPAFRPARGPASARPSRSFPEVLVAPDRAVAPDDAADEIARLHGRPRFDDERPHRQQAEARRRPRGRGHHRRPDRGGARTGSSSAPWRRRSAPAGTPSRRSCGPGVPSRRRSRGSRTTTSAPAPRTCAASRARWRWRCSAAPTRTWRPCRPGPCWWPTRCRPGDFTKVPTGRLAGIVCTQGAATSHLAIMARTHGIPAVLGWREGRDALRAARRVALRRLDRRRVGRPRCRDGRADRGPRRPRPAGAGRAGAPARRPPPRRAGGGPSRLRPTSAR